MDPRPFEDLIGPPLWLVGFAPDGVYLRFAGPEVPELRNRHAPSIETAAGDILEVARPEYRDTLCSSLGAELRTGYWTADEIVLGFDNATLRFPLVDETNGTAPEVGELHSDGLWIFGPEFHDQP